MRNILNKEALSFKKYFFKTNVLLVVLITIFIFISNYFNQNIMLGYEALAKAYINLDNIYVAFDKADEDFKGYLANNNEELLNDYQNELEAAKHAILVIKSNEYIEDKKRFELLSNMLNSYNELCYEIVDIKLKGQDYEDLYNDMLREKRLVDATSDVYYKTITKSMQNEEKRLETINSFTSLIGLMFVAVILTCLINLLYRLFTSLLKPLDVILSNINKIKEGKYNLDKLSTSSKEIEDLCNALDDMANKIQNNLESEREKAKLKDELLKQENENLKKDELLALSELKMLQNQINPHFLFNTLNMINCLINTHDNETASKMIITTSDLLRYGLEMKNAISTIKLELKAISDYVEIQKMRNGERIEFLLNINDLDEIAEVLIPGMILQPLVENSIKHGLKNCLNDGEVEIYVAKDHDGIIIEVSDNGKGMDNDELQAKLKLYDSGDYDEPHFGLYNVIRRLKTYYKERVQIEIITDLNAGFSFNIRIKGQESFNVQCFNC